MGRRIRLTLLFFLHLVRDIAGTLAERVRRRYRQAVLGQECLAVGVDVFPFFERMSGIGWYEWNLLARLPLVDPAIELRFYAQTFGAPDEPSPPPFPTALRTRFRYHHMPEGFLLPIRPTIRALRHFIEPLLLFLDGNDVFFAPNFFVPSQHLPAVTALVPTVHDLGFLRLPHTVQRETLDLLHRHLPRALYSADALIAVSGATAGDLTELAGVSPRRVHVVHEGVDAKFAASPGPPLAGLPPRYLLFISTLEPRKNVVGLLSGFTRAVAEGYPGDLVLVGRWGWRTEAAQEALARSPVASRIHHLDYLDRATLTGVLQRAEALVFPSLLEGFGLPLVEAMACGVPAIVSSTSSLPEVGGDAALYVDPTKPEALAAAILRLAGDPDLARSLAAAGRARAERFRWDDAAAATATVLRRAVGLPSPYADAYRV
ncbi:MAG: glycosyltransferase family 4 protein [Thermoanaerobaculales bacterium]